MSEDLRMQQSGEEVVAFRVGRSNGGTQGRQEGMMHA